MKLLYICGDMGVEIGGRKGASTHVRETCHALMRYGHEVLLITPAPGDLSQVQVPIIEVPRPRAKLLGADLRYVLLNRRMRRAIIGAIEQFRPDAVYERYSLYQTAGLELCRQYNLPRILEINTLLAHEQARRLHWPGYAGRVERSIWRRERAIVVVSQTLKRMVAAAAGIDEKDMVGFVVTPVAVDPQVFHPNVKPVDRTILGLGDKIIAGYMGTLTAWHGVDLFFDAAHEIKQRGENIIILAIGGETDRIERLRERVREEGLESHLRFFGSVQYSEVPGYLAAMDMCLIADTQDWSSPTKFFEFAAMAKPIIASRSPAVEEVFGDLGGFFFTRGNGHEMADRMIEVAHNEEQAARISAAARDRVLAHYTWKCNVRAMMEIYRKMGAVGAKDPDDGYGRREANPPEKKRP